MHVRKRALKMHLKTVVTKACFRSVLKTFKTS